MTTEKMPDAIWASRRPQDVGDCWTGPYKSYDDQTEYLRAEPVEELLKQARDAIYLASLQALEPEDQLEYTTIYTAIDKFLGEK